MKKSKLEILIASALGIAIGALLVLTIQAIQGNNRRLRTEYKDWRKLNLILEQVDAHYVDSVDVQKVTDAAVNAALAALDPHSAYYPPVELEASEEDLAGGFDGIGIQFNVPNDTAVVIEVIPGGPSEKIGLRPGDRILRVDDKVIAGVKFPQDSMVRRMKGHAGTKVCVTVKRGSEEIPFDITRGKIPVHCVDAAFMVNDTSAYIRLSKFSRTTYREVSQAAEQLTAQGMRNLIIDLRDNSGGYLDQALALSNMFLEKDSMIVYIEGRKRAREEFRADGRGNLKDIGLKVLISENTASSSEIFSGAIQDNHRGIIVGRRSFGKGLVQEPFNFTDGSGIRLTVSRFYTPSGRCIQKPYTDDYNYEVYKRYGKGEMVTADSMKVEKGGIVPDIFVPMDTTRATSFYIACNKKATAMRFASSYFDAHVGELENLDDYDQLVKYLDNSGLDRLFREFASKNDGIKASDKEWRESAEYMMPQIYALVGRYSKLGDNAFYHMYLGMDDTFKAALTAQ